jgi:hypothetical protein
MRKGTFRKLSLFKKNHLFHKLSVFTDALKLSACKVNLKKDFQQFRAY